MAALPAQCEVIIVGGGVIGCSVAYHLTKLGITDVVLLERKELTSGTTWHAAGLVGQLRSSINMTKLARYTSELYRELETETGQATGVPTVWINFHSLNRGATRGTQTQRFYGESLRPGSECA